MIVAVCVWGLLRSLQHTHESIQQYVLFPLQNAGYDYDILVHTYSFHGSYSNTRTGEMADAGVMNFSEWKLLQPSYVHVEDQDAFDASIEVERFASHGDPWDNNYESLRNHIRALNSLYHLARVVELVNSDPFYYKVMMSRGGVHGNSNNHQQRQQSYSFDSVIFIRPDVLFSHYLPVELLSHFSKALFVPDFHRSCEGGQLNDRFAMGDAASAIAYGKRYEAALNYSMSRALRSEDFVYDYLADMHVRVIEIPFRFIRVRVAGKMHSRDAHVVLPHEQLALAPGGTMPKETSWPLKLLYKSDVDDPYNIYCSPHPYRINVSEIEIFTSHGGRGAYSQEEISLRVKQLLGPTEGRGGAGGTRGLGGRIFDRTVSAYKDIFKADAASATDDFFMRTDAGSRNDSSSSTASGSSVASSSFASSSALASAEASTDYVVRRGGRSRRAGRRAGRRAEGAGRL